jgi:hypothetical protein
MVGVIKPTYVGVIKPTYVGVIKPHGNGLDALWANLECAFAAVN